MGVGVAPLGTLKNLRVSIQSASVCPGKTPTCVQHAGMFPVHTEAFLIDTRSRDESTHREKWGSACQAAPQTDTTHPHPHCTRSDQTRPDQTSPVQTTPPNTATLQNTQHRPTTNKTTYNITLRQRETESERREDERDKTRQDKTRHCHGYSCRLPALVFNHLDIQSRHGHH